MPKFQVTYYYLGHKTFEVEAASQNEAQDKAEALRDAFSFDLEHNLDALDADGDSNTEEVPA